MPGKFLKDTTIIYSYPRSGLHLLIVGLYMLDRNDPDLSYDEIWGSNRIPSYTHIAASDYWALGAWWRKHAERPYERHILLLRNPCSHYSSVAQSESAYSHVGLEQKMLQHLLDQGVVPNPQQVGCRHHWDTSWDTGMSWYAKTIKQFDHLRPEEDQVEMPQKETQHKFRPASPQYRIPPADLGPSRPILHPGTPGAKKMVVYYEDLVQDEKTLLEVADFIGIKYGEFGHQPGSADFDLIRQNAKRLYLEKGWVPSNKITLKEEEKKELLDKVRGAIGDDETFDKYYKRYT